MTYPNEWPQKLTKAVVSDFTSGMTYTQLCAKYGLTRSALSGKLTRLKVYRNGPRGPQKRPAVVRRPRDEMSDWDHKLRETWAQRKARLARERGRS